jgi:hypothetical protein
MKLLLALAAGTLGYCYYRGSDVKALKGQRKEDLTRWEGEGGNVPAVATPSPVVKPASSRPDGGDGTALH